MEVEQYDIDGIDFYKLRTKYASYSNEVYEMIEWCKENDIQFFTKQLQILTSYSHMKPLQKLKSNNIIITDEDMADKDSITIDIDGEDWIFEKEKMRFAGDNTAFYFNTEEDVMAFKLRWS